MTPNPAKGSRVRVDVRMGNAAPISRTRYEGSFGLVCDERFSGRTKSFYPPSLVEGASPFSRNTMHVVVEFAGLVGEASLGGRGASPDVDGLSFAKHLPRLHRHRAEEVHLELEGRVSGSGGEHRVDGASPIAESKMVHARPPWTEPMGL